MDIRMYLGKRIQKEQSDKSSGEVSASEESLRQTRVRHS